MFWHYPLGAPHFLGGTSAGAMLQGDYKLIRFYDTDKLELYNISTDSSETRNLAIDSASLLSSLASKFHKKLTECLFNFNFPDDFNDKNPADWTTYGGTWSAATGQYTASAGTGVKAITDHRYFTNLQYQAEVSVAGGVGHAGIMCRVSNGKLGVDAYRGYYAGINAQTDMVTFGKANNGSWTLLASKSKTIDTATFYLLRIVAVDSIFKIYVNDTLNPVLTVSDKSFDGGLLGLQTNIIPAVFDNVMARGLQDGSVGTSLVPGKSHKRVPQASGTLMLKQENRGRIFIKTGDQPETGNGAVYDLQGKRAPDLSTVQSDKNEGFTEEPSPASINSNPNF
jgi:hypothetical protein